MIEKMRAVYLIKSYGGEGRKYLEVPRVKYMILQKCEAKYQNVGPNTNLI